MVGIYQKKLLQHSLALPCFSRPHCWVVLFGSFFSPPGCGPAIREGDLLPHGSCISSAVLPISPFLASLLQAGVHQPPQEYPPGGKTLEKTGREGCRNSYCQGPFLTPLNVP